MPAGLGPSPGPSQIKQKPPDGITAVLRKAWLEAFGCLIRGSHARSRCHGRACQGKQCFPAL